MDQAKYWHERTQTAEKVLDFIRFVLREPNLRPDVRIAIAQNEIYWWEREVRLIQHQEIERLVAHQNGALHVGPERPPETT
jgi:hypothetical protein